MIGGGEEEREEYQVEEEFNVWKKNTPFLYDLIVSHSLEWPSLTVHWLPSKPSTYADDTYAIHKMILGTHTSEDFPNFLLVADAHLPVNPASAPNTNLEDPILPKVHHYYSPFIYNVCISYISVFVCTLYELFAYYIWILD